MSNGVNVKDILIEDQSMDTVGNMVIFFYVFLQNCRKDKKVISE